jgi:hypothetical protein
MTITYRLVKGSPLTFAEEDGNFSDLDGRLSTVEGAGFSNPIDSITISGNILTFEYSTSVGGGSDSVAIPTAAWNGRGEWQALTSYAVNDLVIDASRLYLVKIAHTSASSFDPGAQSGGQDIYDFIFGPLGQTEAATLSDTTYTLQGTDDLKYYRCTGTSTAGVTVITIPSNDEVSIPIDSEITFRQCADPLTLEAVTGVTLNPPAAGVTNIGDVFTIKKVDTDEWDFIGPNAEATA